MQCTRLWIECIALVWAPTWGVCQSVGSIECGQQSYIPFDASQLMHQLSVPKSYILIKSIIQWFASSGTDKYFCQIGTELIFLITCICYILEFWSVDCLYVYRQLFCNQGGLELNIKQSGPVMRALTRPNGHAGVAPLQRAKNPVSASALLTGKFLRVRKVFARLICNSSLKGQYLFAPFKPYPGKIDGFKLFASGQF